MVNADHTGRAEYTIPNRQAALSYRVQTAQTSTITIRDAHNRTLIWQHAPAGTITDFIEVTALEWLPDDCYPLTVTVEPVTTPTPQPDAPTLADFLRARLNEDERKAIDARWVVDQGLLILETDPATKAHIARHDPTRVLAEVSAKRRIIAECESAYDQDSRGMAWMADRTLELLALPYHDHPDYQQTWNPDGR